MWPANAPAAPSASAKRARGITAALSTALLISMAPIGGLAAPVTVTLDTTALSGTTAQLAFDLIDGDGVNDNSLAIGGFAGDATLSASAASGGVTGSLPGMVTISDTGFFNELLQRITLGKSLTFTLDFTNNFAGGPTPDGFSFFVLDSAGLNSLVSTDLLGDALLTGDYAGAGAVDIVSAATTAPAISVSVAASPGLPEPSSLLLVLAAGGLAWGLRRRDGLPGITSK